MIRCHFLSRNFSNKNKQVWYVRLFFLTKQKKYCLQNVTDQINFLFFNCRQACGHSITNVIECDYDYLPRARLR